MTPLVAYLLLFLAVGVGFIFVHLVAGMFIRPSKPDVEKGTIYECGEPTIGSAWVQFDLRFYVVALLFVIFDVEVAFFFPWAEVFGKANTVAALPKPKNTDEVKDYASKVFDLAVPPFDATSLLNRRRLEKALVAAEADNPKAADLLPKTQFEQVQIEASSLAWLALIEVLVFFGVLLVGFAYLWRRGDIEWVRSTAAERLANRPNAVPAPPVRETVSV